MRSRGIPADGQRLEAVEHLGLHPRRRAVGPEVRQPVEHQLEGHRSLQPRERRTEAVVDAHTERGMALQVLQVAGDVEAIRIVPGLRVPVGRAEHHVHLGVDRDVDAVERDGAGVRPEQAVHRSVEAEALLDGVGDEGAVLAQQRHLLGPLQQAVDEVADQQGRRLGPGDEQELAEADDLLLGEPLAVALHGQQPREEVVRHGLAGLDGRGPTVDVRLEVGEVGAVGRDHLGIGRSSTLHRHRLGHREHPGAEHRDVLLGHAQQPAHHDEGEGRGQIGDEVTLAPVGEAVDEVFDEDPHVRLHRLDHRGLERPGDRQPLGRVDRWIGRDEHARADLAVGEARPVLRRPRLVVAQRGGDVGLPRQAVVRCRSRRVVDGAPLAQLGEHRGGILLERLRQQAERRRSRTRWSS